MMSQISMENKTQNQINAISSIIHTIVDEFAAKKTLEQADLIEFLKQLNPEIMNKTPLIVGRLYKFFIFANKLYKKDKNQYDNLVAAMAELFCRNNIEVPLLIDLFDRTVEEFTSKVLIKSADIRKLMEELSKDEQNQYNVKIFTLSEKQYGKDQIKRFHDLAKKQDINKIIEEFGDEPVSPINYAFGHRGEIYKKLMKSIVETKNGHISTDPCILEMAGEQYLAFIYKCDTQKMEISAPDEFSIAQETLAAKLLSENESNLHSGASTPIHPQFGSMFTKENREKLQQNRKNMQLKPQNNDKPN